jgi:Tfp pilus assembly protein PilO
MSRIGWVLVGLLCVLLGVGWYFLLFAPTSEDIEDVRAQTAQVEQQAQRERARAAALREVRLEAPEAEARLAFGRTIFPENADIPALFRQLQQATDDAGARLTTIAPASPTEQIDADLRYASIPVSVTVEGSYFQLVDFARRIEDPTLTPRAVFWQGATVDVVEYPVLTATFIGQVFSRNVDDLPELPTEPEPEPDDDVEEDDPDGLDDLDDLDATGVEDES